MKPIFPLLILSTFALSEELTLSPQQAVELALQFNPTLRVTALELDKAAARQQGAGQRANPVLGFSFRQDWLGEDAGEQDIGLSLSQSLPLTARLSRAKELRQHELELARLELSEARRQIAGEVLTETITLGTLDERLHLLDQQVEINQGIVDFLKVGSSSGEVSPLDHTQARLTGQQLLAQRHRLEAQRSEAQLALTQRLGLEAGTEIGLKALAPLPAELPSSAEPGSLLQRPDIRLAQAQFEAAKAQRALQQASRFEDMTVGIKLDQERAGDAPDGLQRNTFIGLALSLPLPIRKPNASAEAEAGVAIQQAKAQLDAMIWTAEQEVQTVLLQRKNSYELARESSGDILTLCEENLAAFQKAQREGQATFLQVQRAQEQLVELRSAALEALAAYHLAEARLLLVTDTMEMP